ncbi:hypothetical protein [Sinorhizobium meliloti]|uniref:hypothetical protein n=1 Tax=Rhizobium meliloti TaxID=382 RepID=UPI0002861B45|nr:hypothetical protein [Sinorhizobium meliloti]ASP83002.1 hypothetical protein CDO27_34895 [Sinorhizobium meliloti]MQW16378.1 hypothetical protein [Sinorhizobium meliloti]CCM69746.1 hypothetical protein BN406_06809 [Sinorhizobium meliloti Rm41]
MHDTKVIFAYQVIPGTDEILAFTETLGSAQQEASQHFEGLKAEDEKVDPGIAIYKVSLKNPDLSDYVNVLNHPEDARERLVGTIERVELIS